jgi:hypothetical protein
MEESRRVVGSLFADTRNFYVGFVFICALWFWCCNTEREESKRATSLLAFARFLTGRRI